MITADVIKDLNSSELTYISGSLQSVAKKVLPPESGDSESLIFVSKQTQLEAALQVKAAIIIAHKSLNLPAESSSTFFSTGSVQLAMATVLPLFDGKMNRFIQDENIHPTAIVHEKAHLGAHVLVGPYAVIGADSKIADGCTIGAHVVIENEVEIGAKTILHPFVFVGAQTQIGHDCEIHPHTTIGADGFSFALAKDGTHKKIPQIGKVIIGNHVEIGANCAIDRAALTETRIGHGTKLDNFCHIAHNCTIGNDCVMAAGFKIAGSSTVGNNCMFGGDAAVADHVNICDRVIIAGRSGVTNDITEPGQYGGYPLEPLRDSLKTLANKIHLTKIRKDLSRVVKHLGLNFE